MSPTSTKNPFSPLALGTPFGPVPPGTAAALEILRPMLKMTQHFSHAERERFWEAVPVFGEALGRILDFFSEAELDAKRQAAIDTALRMTGAPTSESDRQGAEISELKQERLINLIALVCFAYADISSVAPAAAERLRGELRVEVKKSQMREEAARASGQGRGK